MRDLSAELRNRLLQMLIEPSAPPSEAASSTDAVAAVDSKIESSVVVTAQPTLEEEIKKAFMAERWDLIQPMLEHLFEAGFQKPGQHAYEVVQELSRMAYSAVLIGKKEGMLQYIHWIFYRSSLLPDLDSINEIGEIFSLFFARLKKQEGYWADTERCLDVVLFSSLNDELKLHFISRFLLRDIFLGAEIVDTIDGWLTRHEAEMSPTLKTSLHLAVVNHYFARDYSAPFFPRSILYISEVNDDSRFFLKNIEKHLKQISAVERQEKLKKVVGHYGYGIIKSDAGLSLFESPKTWVRLILTLDLPLEEQAMLIQQSMAVYCELNGNGYFAVKQLEGWYVKWVLDVDSGFSGEQQVDLIKPLFHDINGEGFQEFFQTQGVINYAETILKSPRLTEDHKKQLLFFCQGHNFFISWRDFLERLVIRRDLPKFSQALSIYGQYLNKLLSLAFYTPQERWQFLTVTPAAIAHIWLALSKGYFPLDFQQAFPAQEEPNGLQKLVKNLPHTQLLSPSSGATNLRQEVWGYLSGLRRFWPEQFVSSLGANRVFKIAKDIFDRRSKDKVSGQVDALTMFLIGAAYLESAGFLLAILRSGGSEDDKKMAKQMLRDSAEKLLSDGSVVALLQSCKQKAVRGGKLAQMIESVLGNSLSPVSETRMEIDPAVAKEPTAPVDEKVDWTLDESLLEVRGPVEEIRDPTAPPSSENTVRPMALLDLPPASSYMGKMDPIAGGAGRLDPSDRSAVDHLVVEGSESTRVTPASGSSSVIGGAGFFPAPHSTPPVSNEPANTDSTVALRQELNDLPRPPTGFAHPSLPASASNEVVTEQSSAADQTLVALRTR